MAKIERALLSVFDKTGLVPFAKILADAGVELISTGGTAKTLRELASRIFTRTSAYDGAIAAHLAKTFEACEPAKLSEQRLPKSLQIAAPLAQPLRYGENPHQQAGLYGGFHDFFEQLHGKELSYNNI